MPEKNYSEKDYYYLGKILRPHGYKGGLKVTLDVDDPSAYKSLDIVFAEMKRNLVPFFIESIHLEGNKANIKLQDIDDLAAAERMANCKLFLPIHALPALKGNKFYFHEIEGFKVYDEARGFIGEVEKVLDLPNNALFSIRFEGKEILIPVVDEIIRNLDRKNKRLDIRAPEGLIDIYL